MKKDSVKRVIIISIALIFVIIISNGILIMNRKNRTGRVVIWTNKQNYEYIENLADVYMSNNKDSNIIVKNYSEKDYNKLESIYKSNTAVNKPDVICLNIDQLEEIKDKDIKIRSSSSLLDKYSNNFSKRMIQDISDGEEMIGIPFTSNPIIMFLRQDLLDKYGYNYEDIRTWDDFICMGEEVYNKSNGQIKVLNAIGDDYTNLVSLLVMQGMEISDNEFIIKEYVDTMLAKLEKKNIMNKQENGKYLARVSSVKSVNEIKNIEQKCQWTANNAPSAIVGGNRFYLCEGTYLSIISHDTSDDDEVDDFMSYLISNKKVVKKYAYSDVFYSSFNAYTSITTEAKVKNYLNKSPYLVMSNISIKAPSISDFDLYIEIKNEYIS